MGGGGMSRNYYTRKKRRGKKNTHLSQEFSEIFFSKPPGLFYNTYCCVSSVPDNFRKYLAKKLSDIYKFRPTNMKKKIRIYPP